MGKIIRADYLVRKKRGQWHETTVKTARYRDNVKQIFGTKSGAQKHVKLSTLTKLFFCLKGKVDKIRPIFQFKWSQE